MLLFIYSSKVLMVLLTWTHP